MSEVERLLRRGNVLATVLVVLACAMVILLWTEISRPLTAAVGGAGLALVCWAVVNELDWRRKMRGAGVVVGLVLGGPAAAECRWTEPARTYPAGLAWSCVAVGWMDGDTLAARCDGQDGTVSVRVRGVDTEERGEARHGAARDELRRRTARRALEVQPRHQSYQRVVADVLADGENVGAAMDAAGWSKRDCPKR